MSYLALYRKYRPVDFENVYGQEEVVTVIKNAIISNKISHAYLFSGPRGTGKTTIAKIIARLVNCDSLEDGKSCGKCYNCINFTNSNDVVEIDAASNNGVDEIRELRDKINLVPSNAKYKVYIIDEVHMLTTQAFNALLKTLEEPPSHVIFILATTEPHKIPLTISSRCQKFRFSKISDNLIVDRLKEISKLESIVIDDDALFEIARLADGGMRDAINLLDQLVAYGSSKIAIEDVYKVNGSVAYSDIYMLLDYIIKNDKINLIGIVDSVQNDGKEINKFIQELIVFLKDVILYKNADILSSIKTKNDNIILIANLYDNNIIYDLIGCLNKTLISVKNSTHGFILFMTAMLRFSDTISGKYLKNKDLNFTNNTNVCDSKNISREIKSKNSLGNIINKESEDKIINTVDKENIKHEKDISDEEIDIRINNALALASKDILNEIKNKWFMIDDYISDDKYSVVAGLLKDSIPVVGSNKYLIIGNSFDSSVDRINENIEIIQKLFSDIFGYDLLAVAITSSRWNDLKKKYISDIKNGVKYMVKDIPKNVNKLKKEKTSVDELIDIVGDSLIEFK